MTVTTDCAVVNHLIVNHLQVFVDENTGREIRRLTNFETGAHLGYFRMFKQIPDGRILAWARHEQGRAILIDPDSGDLELLPLRTGALKLRESDGRMWYIQSSETREERQARKVRQRYSNGRSRTPAGMELWHIDLPDGQPVLDAMIPEGLPGTIADITIDGQSLILTDREQDLTDYPIPTTKDVSAVNHYFVRPRRGETYVHHLASGQTTMVVETQDICTSHEDTSPEDPTLLRYAQDMPETRGQRIWTVRTDGTDRRQIRPQQRGEMVTHEFWWADPNYIGYTYQDRRQDPTVLTHHWAEYALAPTRLGIADLTGREVYLSDPMACYHSHLYRSNDGQFVSGEGTEGNQFVFAGRLDMKSTKLDMVPLATTHTPYVPFRGQGVDCNFSADSRWLIYADKITGEGYHQLYAVEVDL